MDQLEDKVADVTAGSQGIGAATVSRLARAGAMVVIVDIVADQGESLASQLRAQRLKARYRQLDVRLEASWADLVDDVRRSEGRLDVLVNNAAVTHRAGSVNTSVHDWERVIGVNLTGSYLGIRSCAPLMRESGASSIINFASVAGLAG